MRLPGGTVFARRGSGRRGSGWRGSGRRGSGLPPLPQPQPPSSPSAVADQWPSVLLSVHASTVAGLTLIHKLWIFPGQPQSTETRWGPASRGAGRGTVFKLRKEKALELIRI